MEKIECFDRMEKIDDSGHEGIIYRISEDKCVKVLKNKYRKDLLENEFKIAKFLFERGVSVPEPYGIISVNSPYHYGIVNAFIMEYIEGSVLTYKMGEKYSELFKRAKLERIKIKNLGVSISDTNQKNVLYSEKKDKIYLIDFISGRKYEF